MPLLVFDCKGVPATRPERIEAAVEAARQACSGALRSADRAGLALTPELAAYVAVCQNRSGILIGTRIGLAIGIVSPPPH